MLTLKEETELYRNTQEYNFEVWQRFVELTNANQELKSHRDFVEKHVYGFGDRAFHWMWKLIVDELPQPFKFLEIGVYKGQVPSLVRLLERMRGGTGSEIWGVTPLSSFSGELGQFPKFPETDYLMHIKNLHDEFGLEMPNIIHGDSTDPAIVEEARSHGPYDVVYIDGCHEYNYVIKDNVNYPPMVKPGGFLVIDDCSNFLAMPQGFFPGIIQVSQAVRATIEQDKNWEHLLAIMHNRIWKNGRIV